jgi:hypothetical protein
MSLDHPTVREWASEGPPRERFLIKEAETPSDPSEEATLRYLVSGHLYASHARGRPPST